jgi:hypothetical protein
MIVIQARNEKLHRQGSVSLKSKKKRRLELKGVPLPIQSSVYRRLRGLFTISKLHPYPISYYRDIFTTPTLSIYIEPAVDTQAADTEGDVTDRLRL